MARLDPRVFLAAALLAALLACSDQPQTESSVAADAAMPAAGRAQAGSAHATAAAEEAKAVAQVQQPGVAADQLASSANTATGPQRRFVRTADASFQVQDVYASTLAIEDAVAAEGGFVVRNSISTQTIRQLERPLADFKRLQLSEVVTQGSLVVRVPGERTQSFLRVIARQMQFLDTRNFEANDVQFELLRRQLAFARAQELQQAIRSAAAQPARTGEKIDALAAREQMLAIRDEATVAQRELEDRIAFSTLRLELHEPSQVRENTVPDTAALLRDRGPGFFAEMREALGTGWRALLAATVFATRLWPLGIGLAVIAWVIGRLRRARRSGYNEAVSRRTADPGG